MRAISSAWRRSTEILFTILIWMTIYGSHPFLSSIWHDMHRRNRTALGHGIIFQHQKKTSKLSRLFTSKWSAQRAWMLLSEERGVLKELWWICVRNPTHCWTSQMKIGRNPSQQVRGRMKDQRACIRKTAAVFYDPVRRLFQG